MVPEIWILETVSSSLPTHPVLVRTLVIRVTFLNIEKPGGHIQKLPKLINKASHKEFLEPSIHAASAIILHTKSTSSNHAYSEQGKKFLYLFELKRFPLENSIRCPTKHCNPQKQHRQKKCSGDSKMHCSIITHRNKYIKEKGEIGNQLEPSALKWPRDRLTKKNQWQLTDLSLASGHSNL